MDHEPNQSDDAPPLEAQEHAGGPEPEAVASEPRVEHPDEGLEYLDSEGLPSWSANAPFDSGDSHRALLDALSRLETEGDEAGHAVDISGLAAPISSAGEPHSESSEPTEANSPQNEHPGELAGETGDGLSAAVGDEVSESVAEAAEWRALEEAEAAAAGESPGEAADSESHEPAEALAEANAEWSDSSPEHVAAEAAKSTPHLAEPTGEAEHAAEAWDTSSQPTELHAEAAIDGIADESLEAATSVPPDDDAWGALGELEGALAPAADAEAPADHDFRALLDALAAEAGENEGDREGEGAEFDHSQESDDLVRALEQAGPVADENENPADWPVDEADIDEDADIEALGRQLNPESGEYAEQTDLAAALNDELSFHELEDEEALGDEAGSGGRPHAPELWLNHAEGASVEVTAEELVDRTAQESFDEMLEAFEAAEAAEAAGAVNAEAALHAEPPVAPAEAETNGDYGEAAVGDLAALANAAGDLAGEVPADEVTEPVEEEVDEAWSLIGASAEFDPSTLEVRRIGPERGAGDQPVTYGFVVRNTAPVALSRVRVEHVLPTGARCIGVQPTPEVFINNSKLVWHLGEVEAGAEHCFLVRVERPGGVVLPSEATAILHACYYLKAPVTRPRLYMKIDGPPSARVGEPVVFQLEVKNTGTAPARQLTLHEQLGPGLHHAIGAQIDANLGTLRPGESLHLTLTTTATQPGKQTNIVTVRSAEDVQATVQAEVLLLQAALAVRASRLVHCLVDQANEYRIEVRNPGTAPIEQALLIDTLPEELEFRGASDDGQFDKADQSVSWVIGGLKPGEIRSYFVQFQAKLPGDHTHRVLAWSDCGLEATDEATIVAEIDERQPSHLLEDLLATIDREDEQSWVAGGPLDRPTMLSRAARAAGQQHIVFSMGDVDYAIPVESVVEYGHPLGVTPVPNLPAWLLGVANLHGDIISMVDLRRFLGLEGPDFDRDGRMLVVRSKCDDLTVGLVVDRVKGIRVVGQETFTVPASPVEDRLAPFVRGATELSGRLLFLLNLDQLLHSPEMRQFEPV